jgi:hypothetical protein
VVLVGSPTVRPPGTVGAWVSGAPPSQATPLILQLSGAPWPAPLKPNAVVPPAGTEPL